MTDQTIPADKVRGVINEIDDCLDGTYLNDQARRALEAAKVSIENILPAPPQPTSGLLGRWAKHPDYGDVMCSWDKPGSKGDIPVRWMAENEIGGLCGTTVPLDSLTFPEQATRPEEVPAGEAWLVNLNGGKHTRVVALKASHDTWRIGRSDSIVTLWRDESVELICPLTPERPGKDDLQVRFNELDKSWCYLDGKYSTLREDYDALDAKYREAQDRIKTLEQPPIPCTVTTKEEYAALPIGSRLVGAYNDVWKKGLSGNWIQELSYKTLSDAKLSGTTRTVVRYGWVDEQPEPVWRIEHDWQNLKAGEYAIDKEGYDGIIRRKSDDGSYWLTDESWVFFPEYAPFIVFPSVDAATPEAIEEAKQARDKEMGK